MDVAQIESQALMLPESERAVLVDHLQASLSSHQISYLNEHISEAEDRISAYKEGNIKSLDGGYFVSSLRKSLTK